MVSVAFFLALAFVVSINDLDGAAQGGLAATPATDSPRPDRRFRWLGHAVTRRAMRRRRDPERRSVAQAPSSGAATPVP